MLKVFSATVFMTVSDAVLETVLLSHIGWAEAEISAEQLVREKHGLKSWDIYAKAEDVTDQFYDLVKYFQSIGEI